MLTLRAYAKINLALKVGARRDDGFHEIWSPMQAISLHDTLTFTQTVRTTRDTLSITGPEADSIQGDLQDNLILKTIGLFRERIGAATYFSVTLEKNIPAGAGLGGGSSDAAATIKALNQTFNMSVPRNQLLDLAAELGSDVPFFFSSGSALATGRGEVISDIQLPTDYHLIVVVPDFHVPTAGAYRALGRPLKSESGANTFLTGGDIESNFAFSDANNFLWARLRSVGNDFETKFLEDRRLTDERSRGFQVGFASTLSEIKSELSRLGAIHTQMSGSGSAVFGVFRDPIVEAQQTSLKTGFRRVYVCRPVMFV